MEDELERNMTTLFEINKESKKNNQMDFKMFPSRNDFKSGRKMI